MKSLVKVLVLASAFFSISASALPWSEGSNSLGMDMGLLAGYRLNDASSKSSATSIDGEGTFQIGGLAFLPLGEKFKLRTGFIYSMRNYEAKVKATGVTSDVEYAHFDIPLTFMYTLSDMGGIFVGPGLSIKMKDDCDGNDCDGAKSTMIPFSFGGHFKVAPQFAMEVYYEMVAGDLDDNIEDPSAVVLNAVVTFE
ncbi:MAG: outer membrane beta-barrel protein [Bdellovibrionota bacterium]